MRSRPFACLCTLGLVACGSSGLVSLPADAGPALSCGPGTIQVDYQCLPSATDAGVEIDATSTHDDGTSTQDAGPGNAPDGGFVVRDAGPASSFGVNPAHDNAVPDAHVASPLKPAWTAKLDGPVSFPVIVGERAIVAAAGAQATMRALDLAAGTTTWGPIVVGSPVLLAAEGAKVFALDANGNLAAHDTSDGHPLWTVQLTGQLEFPSPPVASGGLVYVEGLESGGTLYAVDSETGRIVWTADTFDGSDGTVAVSGGMLFEAEACDQVSAFDLATGHLAWFHKGSCTGGGGTTPAVYQGLVWVRDSEGNIILDATGTGKGSFQGEVNPALFDGKALYVNKGSLTAVDIASGTLKWSFSGDGALCTSPVVAGAGKQVFVGSSSGNVYELDLATGAQISVAAGSPVTCGGDKQAMGLSTTRLLVPAGNALVAY